MVAKAIIEERDASRSQFERVLEAEKAADRGLEGAKRQVNDIIAAARAREEAIGKRADERISRLHVAMRRQVDTAIARQRGEFAAAYQGDDGPRIVVEAAALKRAVDRLAARLTGQDDEDSS